MLAKITPVRVAEGTTFRHEAHSKDGFDIGATQSEHQTKGALKMMPGRPLAARGKACAQFAAPQGSALLDKNAFCAWKD